MKEIFCVTALLLLVLQGCASDLFPGGRQTTPEETTSELIVMGASLGPLRQYGSSLPDDIGATVDSERPGFVRSGELAITIVPNEFVQQNIDSGTFLYAFSRHIGEDFELLTNPRFSTPEEPIERINVELFNNTSLQSSESLTDIADFFLDSNVFFVPFNATHLELRYTANENSDPISVERWELSRFYGYNRYLKPIIDASQ